jgi:hypothetical protein
MMPTGGRGPHGRSQDGFSNLLESEPPRPLNPVSRQALRLPRSPRRFRWRPCGLDRAPVFGMGLASSSGPPGESELASQPIRMAAASTALGCGLAATAHRSSSKAGGSRPKAGTLSLCSSARDISSGEVLTSARLRSPSGPGREPANGQIQARGLPRQDLRS